MGPLSWLATCGRSARAVLRSDCQLRPQPRLQQRPLQPSWQNSQKWHLHVVTAESPALLEESGDDIEAPEELHPVGPEEVELPKASHTKVKTAEYVGSAVKLTQCPPPKLPEFAIIGRSNVGKSSLINMLTGRASLALTSKTPGKTQCINHFIINKTWYLVDLPGYGYAKRAKTSRLEWNEFTKEYFLKRESLAMVLLLVDGSIPPQAIDLECAMWLAESEVPFTLVFTKIDKRKKKLPSPAANIKEFCDKLLEEFRDLPMVIKTSAIKATGRLELLGFIAQLRTLVEQQAKRG
ncbi:hypothetical protein WJX84_010058 [Apatococcus fuscideae]|uniref:EngB-type G domain-containing protein n=1 Tax=Apatococcus fuscideae TaxID=2026836 RepID=A0AAW1RK22_9CHLO